MARITLFVLSFIMWLALTCPVSIRQGTIDMQSILAWLLAAGLTAMIFHDFTRNPHKAFHPMRYIWFLIFIPVFIWECIKANIHVAYLVLHPALPIHPGIVKVKTRLTSETGRTFLANCITLTPGTLTIDVTDDGYLYVHWIDVRTRDVRQVTELIIGRFERYLTRICD